MNSGCYVCTFSECTQSQPSLANRLRQTLGTYVMSNRRTSWSSVCMPTLQCNWGTHHPRTPAHHRAQGPMVGCVASAWAARVALPPLRQNCLPDHRVPRHHHHVRHIALETFRCGSHLQCCLHTPPRLHRDWHLCTTLWVHSRQQTAIVSVQWVVESYCEHITGSKQQLPWVCIIVGSCCGCIIVAYSYCECAPLASPFGGSSSGAGALSVAA